MNFQNILAFITIAEYGNISAAANALHYTPPGIAEALKQLEKELGTQLLIRKRGARTVVLTSAGKAFMPIAQKWAALNKEIDQFIITQKKQRLRIAASNLTLSYIVPNITQRLMQYQPQVELQLQSKSNPEIIDGIKESAFDIGFCYSSAYEKTDATIIPFYEEERIVLCAADTILPDRIISVEELPAEHRIIYNKPQVLLSKDYANWQKENLDIISITKPKIKVPDWLAISAYLTDPYSWAFVPISIAQLSMALRPGKLAIRRVEPSPPPRRCMLMISQTYHDKAVLQSFLESCGEFLATQTNLKSLLPNEKKTGF